MGAYLTLFLASIYTRLQSDEVYSFTSRNYTYGQLKCIWYTHVIRSIRMNANNIKSQHSWFFFNFKIQNINVLAMHEQLQPDTVSARARWIRGTIYIYKYVRIIAVAFNRSLKWSSVLSTPPASSTAHLSAHDPNYQRALLDSPNTTAWPECVTIETWRNCLFSGPPLLRASLWHIILNHFTQYYIYIYIYIYIHCSTFVCT